MAFNEFSEVTFADGVAPPINAANLNALEGVVAETDEELARSKSFKLTEYLEYFRKRNQKDIDQYQGGFTAYSTGNPAACSLSDEDIGNVLGDIGLNVNIDDNGANWTDHQIVLGSALDLTEFYDGNASTTDDMICIFFFVSDEDSIQGTGRQIYFNIGNGGTGNTYEYDFDIDAWGFGTGWNIAWVPKSSFYVWAGAPNWNNIDFVQIQVEFNAGYEDEYFIFNLVQMTRADPVDSDYPNPFQKYMGSVSSWENKLAPLYDVWGLVKDLNIQTEKLGILKFNPPNYESPFTPGVYRNGMLIYEDVNCFVSKFEWICKESGELPSMTFYIDLTHYAEVYVTSSVLYLSVANGGAAVDTTWTFDNTLDKQEKLVIFFEKHDNTLRAIAYKRGEILGVCEYETTFSSPGDIYLGVSNDSSFGILTDFTISHSMNQIKLAKRNIPVVIRKLEDETINNDSSLNNDSDIWCYLEPNQAYRVELHAIVSTESDARDIKIAWSLSDGVELVERTVIGPCTASASSYNTEVKISAFGISESAVYGVDNAVGRPSHIFESFVIRSGETGGKLQMQWAQYSAGAYDTTMEENTSIIITPVEMR
jgi:hypothetical protein